MRACVRATRVCLCDVSTRVRVLPETREPPPGGGGRGMKGGAVERRGTGGECLTVRERADRAVFR